MHLLATDSVALDETAAAVDLGQSAADIVFLSFTDSDLAVLAAAWDKGREAGSFPDLRLASLAQLKHPYSVDLYVEKVICKARFVLVRLLGGMDYWRYGVDELAACARARGFHLAFVPGDSMGDARLDAASTLPPQDLLRLWGYFQEGGPDNMRACLESIAGMIGTAGAGQGSSRPFARSEAIQEGATRTPWIASPRSQGRNEADMAAPRQVPAFGQFAAGCRAAVSGAPQALIVFYRSVYLAADTAPILALSDGLAARGFGVTAAYVTSLKDPEAIAPLAGLLAILPPDVILNTTAFSARLDQGAGVLDGAGAPVFQVIQAGSSAQQWAGSQRGLGASDLAMNVVLPEIDGRIVAGAISFKAETGHRASLQFTRLAHAPDASRIAHVAQLAAAWALLRRTARENRRLALVLSDYPAKGGRTGYAVGLDTPQSVIAMAQRLAEEGYDAGAMPDAAGLMQLLGQGGGAAVLAVGDYAQLFGTLPDAFTAAVNAAWGAPADDAAVRDGKFHVSFVRAGKLIVAVQPDRGRLVSRKSDYHDGNLMPCHGYIAFYLWLREVERVHALVHCGTHGTLEWLPGKAVALSGDCAPQVVLGAMPVIYPFIVNNPGEAGQAKRRIAAVTIGHLTPPLTGAGAHGAAAEIESLLDEYAQAQTLDPRRARLLADGILARAEETGLMADSGIITGDPAATLGALDAWLCDIKEMRIGDGLHVFGQGLDSVRRATMAGFLAQASGADTRAVGAMLDACAGAEMRGLLAGLDGRFVEPGPAGAPAQGRLDVLPTGRNLFTIDPRAVPTRAAWDIGQRTAREVTVRHAQEHGEWPRAIVLDLWGSASMRTGGDDLAQAYALMGVRPRWDDGSNRVNGFDIMPLATLAHARVDVTLRISGLFRDVFPAQIALFDAAARAVAGLDEENADNPLAASVRAGGAPERIFGAAPGEYGIGLGRAILAGDWQSRDELGEIYLQATSHAYGAGEGAASEAFRARVKNADAFVHVQDMDGQDVLDSDAFHEHEGGFASAAALLGGNAAIYHADTTRAGRSSVRTLAQEVARVVRGRASNPRWLAGQMRHGHRGAAEIAETIDNLFAYAATSDAAPSRHFDAMFDATCGNEMVRAFLLASNREAAKAIARRFEDAIARGYWQSRRNSVAAILAEMGAE